MAKDDFRNLGFKEEAPAKQADGRDESGVKGELRW
jgi:hypothetical protein